MGGVEYQVTKVDPTDPETKGMVYQVYKVSEEVAATLGGKVYRARIIKDPTYPTVAGKVYQIVLIGDPDDPAVKGKVYNAILTGGSEATIVGPAVSPLELPDAVAGELEYVKAYGGTELSGTPTPSTPATITCNNGILKVKDSELPVAYKRIVSITGDGDVYYNTGEKLYGSDVITMTVTPGATAGQNLFGAYTGTGAGIENYSMYVYGTNSSDCYFRFGSTLYRPTLGTGKRTITFGAPATTGFFRNVNVTADTFESDANAWIFGLPNSSSPKFTGTITGNITVGNRLKYIPCERVSDGAIGYYEINTETFLEPKAGTPTAGAYDTSYMTEVYVDPTGTVETIEDTLGNSATCEPLLAVGDYVDVQEILSGAVTRNVGYVVLTGEEDWTRDGSAIYADVFTNKNTTTGSEICSHYTYDSSAMADMPDNTFKVGSTNYPQRVYFKDTTNVTSVSSWTTYLKAQSVAGTPVIIVYPLATPTTESVTGQTLQVEDGDNTIEITQASLTGLELEAEYGKEAE